MSLPREKTLRDTLDSGLLEYFSQCVPIFSHTSMALEAGHSYLSLAPEAHSWEELLDPGEKRVDPHVDSGLLSGGADEATPRHDTDEVAAARIDEGPARVAKAGVLASFGEAGTDRVVGDIDDVAQVCMPEPASVPGQNWNFDFHQKVRD